MYQRQIAAVATVMHSGKSSRRAAWAHITQGNWRDECTAEGGLQQLMYGQRQAGQPSVRRRRVRKLVSSSGAATASLLVFSGGARARRCGEWLLLAAGGLAP
jgi:hypothetical protein